MTDIFSLLRKNSTAILFVIYAFCTLIYFDQDIITFTSIGTLLLLILAIKYLSKKQNTLIRKSGFILFTVILVYYDNIFMPDIFPYLRSTYIVITLSVVSLVLNIKISPYKLISSFLALNLIFIFMLFLFREENPDFTVNKNPDNLVFKNISTPSKNNKNILLVVLDGYPSKRSFSLYNNIQTGLDSILNNYLYSEFNTKYTSTPLSLTNILFGAEYDPKMKGLSQRQNEIKLFNDAYEKSTLNNLLEKYDRHWLSFLYSNKNSEILGFSFWRIICFRSADKVLSFKLLKLLGIDVTQHFYNNKINTYNTTMLNDFKNEIKSSKKPKFILLHYLTFHRLLPMDTLYRFADSLMAETLKVTPKDYTVMVFSDHGNREKYIPEKDRNSGIFYINSKDSSLIK